MFFFFSLTSVLKAVSHKNLAIIRSITITAISLSTVFAQSGSEEGSGLEIYLLLDCSKSIWQDKTLRIYHERVMDEIIQNLRNIDENGDCISITIFSNIPKPLEGNNLLNLDYVGKHGKTKEKLQRLMVDIAEVEKEKIPNIKILDMTKTDFVSVLQNLIKTFERDREQSPENLHKDKQPKIIIFVTDGIHDPKNENKAGQDTLSNDDERAIRSFIRDLRDHFSVQTSMFQLPSQRLDNDSLVYSLNKEWKEILGELHFAPPTKNDMGHYMKDAFRSYRSIISEKVLVTSDGFKIDRRNVLKGTLVFDMPPIESDWVSIRIELENIIFNKNGEFDPQKLGLSKSEEELFGIWKTIRSGTKTHVEIEITIPSSVKRIPFSAKGCVKFNFMHPLFRSTEYNYYLSFVVPAPECRNSIDFSLNRQGG